MRPLCSHCSVVQGLAESSLLCFEITWPANLFIIAVKCIIWIWQRIHYFPLMGRYSAAVLGKINSETVEGQKQKWQAMSWREKCQCDCCCRLTLCSSYEQKDAEYTHTNGLSSAVREERGLCVWLWLRKWQECRRTVSELWEVWMLYS